MYEPWGFIERFSSTINANCDVLGFTACKQTKEKCSYEAYNFLSTPLYPTYLVSFKLPDTAPITLLYSTLYKGYPRTCASLLHTYCSCNVVSSILVCSGCVPPRINFSVI